MPNTPLSDQSTSKSDTILQTRLDLYHLVVPLAGLGIWEQNLTTGAIYCNGVVCQIMEVEPDYPWEPQTASLFYKNPELIDALMKSVIATGHPEQAEMELITSKCTGKWVRIKMNLRSEQPLEKLLYGTLEDITSEVNLRRLIEERERQFTSAFDNAPIGMALVSPAGSWLKVNKSLCTLLGLDESDLYSRTFQEITVPEDLSLDLMQMQDLLDGKIDQYNMEKRYFHKDGHTIWAWLSVSLVKDNEGAPLYFISQIKDITEIKKNLEIIKARNEQLQNFAHIVSHNLRSHAGNIRMIAEMAVIEKQEEEKTLMLEMLTESADNLLETLSQLNEVVTIQNNGQNNRKKLCILTEIQRVIKILSASIRHENIEICIDIPEQIHVLIDPSYLESIFMNLLSNSIRYKHPGRRASITISAFQQASTVLIKFSDNGLGIDMELHGHKLFGMYKTFHSNSEARGLGLFLVKNQIEAMGGTISAESVVNSGTTFTIELKIDPS